MNVIIFLTFILFYIIKDIFQMWVMHWLKLSFHGFSPWIGGGTVLRGFCVDYPCCSGFPTGPPIFSRSPIAHTVGSLVFLNWLHRV